jgi:hypothetical protein
MTGPWIVDTDPTFTRVFTSSTANDENVPAPRFFGSSAELLEGISDPCVYVPVVFLNWNVETPGPLALIRALREARPVTPVYLTHETRSPLPPGEILRLGLAGTVSKLDDYSKWTAGFPHMAFIQDGRIDPDLGDAKGSFIPVPVTDFLHERELLFDVHIRLPGSGKMIKLVGAGDSLSIDRVVRYLRRGVKFFYIAKAGHRAALSYADLLANVLLLLHSKVALEARVHYSLLIAAKDLGRISRLPPGDVHIDAAMEFLSNVLRITQEGPAAHAQVARTLVELAPLHDHALLVTAATGLLTLPLGIEADVAYRRFGLAAYLQNVGMTELPERLMVEDPAVFTTADRQLYESHPERGARILRKSGAFDEVVVQAVAQHHERRDGRGFPGMVGAGDISTVAATVGIADQIVSLLKRKRFQPSLRIAETLERDVFPGYAFKVAEAARAVFFPHLRG